MANIKKGDLGEYLSRVNESLKQNKSLADEILETLKILHKNTDSIQTVPDLVAFMIVYNDFADSMHLLIRYYDGFTKTCIPAINDFEKIRKNFKEYYSELGRLSAGLKMYTSIRKKLKKIQKIDGDVYNNIKAKRKGFSKDDIPKLLNQYVINVGKITQHEKKCVDLVCLQLDRITRITGLMRQKDTSKVDKKQLDAAYADYTRNLNNINLQYLLIEELQPEIIKAMKRLDSNDKIHANAIKVYKREIKRIEMTKTALNDATQNLKSLKEYHAQIEWAALKDKPKEQLTTEEKLKIAQQNRIIKRQVAQLKVSITSSIETFKKDSPVRIKKTIDAIKSIEAIVLLLDKIGRYNKDKGKNVSPVEFALGCLYSMKEEFEPSQTSVRSDVTGLQAKSKGGLLHAFDDMLEKYKDLDAEKCKSTYDSELQYVTKHMENLTKAK